MTLAVAKAIMSVGVNADELTLKRAFITCMQDIGNRYAQGEYGGNFVSWLRTEDPQPYGSWGNGAAMRVSSVGWFFNSVV